MKKNVLILIAFLLTGIVACSDGDELDLKKNASPADPLSKRSEQDATTSSTQKGSWGFTKDLGQSLNPDLISVVNYHEGENVLLYFTTQVEMDLLIFCDVAPLSYCREGKGKFMTTSDGYFEHDYWAYLPSFPYILEENKESLDLVIIGLKEDEIVSETYFNISFNNF